MMHGVLLEIYIDKKYALKEVSGEHPPTSTFVFNSLPVAAAAAGGGGNYKEKIGTLRTSSRAA